MASFLCIGGAIIFAGWFLFALVVALASPLASLGGLEGFFSVVSIVLLGIGIGFRNASLDPAPSQPTTTNNKSGEIVSYILAKVMLGAAIVLNIFGVAFIVIGWTTSPFILVIGMGLFVMGIISAIIALILSRSSKRTVA